MKSWACLIAAILLGSAAAPIALAGDHDRDHGRGPPESRAEDGRGRGGDQDQRGRREERERGDYGYGPPARAPSYRYDRPDYGRAPAPYYPAPRPAPYPSYPGYRNYPSYRPPAYGPERYGPERYGPPAAYGRWRRGQVLPPAFRGDVVGDYGRYHLRRPPRGYYWVRQGDDFVLVAITTGLIFEVISGGY